MASGELLELEQAQQAWRAAGVPLPAPHEGSRYVAIRQPIGGRESLMDAEIFGPTPYLFEEPPVDLSTIAEQTDESHRMLAHPMYRDILKNWKANVHMQTVLRSYLSPDRAGALTEAALKLPAVALEHEPFMAIFAARICLKGKKRIILSVWDDGATQNAPALIEAWMDAPAPKTTIRPLGEAERIERASTPAERFPASRALADDVRAAGGTVSVLSGPYRLDRYHSSRVVRRTLEAPIVGNLVLIDMLRLDTPYGPPAIPDSHV